MSAASVPLLAVLLLIGCSSGTAPFGAAGRLEARAAAGTLAVTNLGTRPVFTFVIGRELTALINWAPCVDATICPPIAPGATLRIAYPADAIPAGEHEALVYWWYARHTPGRAPEPDRIRALVVPLP